MSMLTTIWRHLTKQSTTRKRLRIAILTTAQSAAMSHYIERLSAYIEVMSPHGVIFQIYRDFSNPQEERRFKAEHERFAYSGIIAMDCLAGQSLVRLKHQIVLESPAIILGYKELLPMPLPKNVIGFFLLMSQQRFFSYCEKFHQKAQKFLLLASAVFLNM